MTQFKDKSAKREGDFISAGLFTYPALQAADILLYDARRCPSARISASTSRSPATRAALQPSFGETFVIPRQSLPRPGAGDGPAGSDVEDEQVGDTDAGCIMLMDDPADIARKFKRAVTDSDNEVTYDRAKKPGVTNLLEILSVCTGTSPQDLAASTRSTAR
jgi:tryptophanyl-tRNA synthetase